jgi:2,5-diamino-6-(ribosylamino)-4(3H)-pyrimidinone 5'-phosphate reductase
LSTVSSCGFIRKEYWILGGNQNKRKLEKWEEKNRIEGMNRTKNTLFLLSSVDGKISLSDIDNLDYDKDLPKIELVKQWLYQYYDLEQQTDLYSLNSGRVLAKIGINDPIDSIEKLPVSFIVIDNKPHLTQQWLENLIRKSVTLFIITTNKNHPAFIQKTKNLKIIYYEDSIDFKNLFEKLHNEFKIDNVTIQSGWELNSVFLRSWLIDKISLVFAPILVGGNTTPWIIWGKPIPSINEIWDIWILKLDDVKVLENSYVHLNYSVISNNES